MACSVVGREGWLGGWAISPAWQKSCLHGLAAPAIGAGGLDMNFETAWLHFYGEHHGKGRNDGQFGLQRQWLDQYAATHVVSGIDRFILALREGAAETMREDPPPRGPSYTIVQYDKANTRLSSAST